MTTASERSPESVLLRSLTHLMARWSSPALQASFADEVGVRIETADIPALYMLGMTGPARASDLADALHLSRPTMSKQLSRLQRDDFVVRTPDPADGRATIVRLSERGERAHRMLVDSGHRMVREALRDWPADEAAHFARQLTRFTAQLGIDHPDGPPAAGPQSP